MQEITADLSKLPSLFEGHPAQRVETGALQINDDWPGVFIRGDNAMFYAVQLSRMLDQHPAGDEPLDIVGHSALNSLVAILRSCAIMRDIEADPIQGMLDLEDQGAGC